VHGCDGGVPTAPLVARFAQSQGRNCAPADWFLNHQRQPSRTTGGRDHTFDDDDDDDDDDATTHDDG
jgi:hypothetical protein